MHLTVNIEGKKMVMYIVQSGMVLCRLEIKYYLKQIIKSIAYELTMTESLVIAESFPHTSLFCYRFSLTLFSVQAV